MPPCPTVIFSIYKTSNILIVTLEIHRTHDAPIAIKKTSTASKAFLEGMNSIFTKVKASLVLPLYDLKDVTVRRYISENGMLAFRGRTACQCSRCTPALRITTSTQRRPSGNEHLCLGFPAAHEECIGITQSRRSQASRAAPQN